MSIHECEWVSTSLKKGPFSTYRLWQRCKWCLSEWCTFIAVFSSESLFTFTKIIIAFEEKGPFSTDKFWQRRECSFIRTIYLFRSVLQWIPLHIYRNNHHWNKTVYTWHHFGTESSYRVTAKEMLKTLQKYYSLFDMGIVCLMTMAADKLLSPKFKDKHP